MKITNIKSIDELINHPNYNKITNLEFDLLFNEYIPPGTLPPLLNHLTFNEMFNQELNKDSLPPLLTHLVFGYRCNFNKDIRKNVLPPLLTDLIFGPYSKYNQEFAVNILPPLLTNLKFEYCSKFNQKLKINVLPQSLKYLLFDGYFNQSIDKYVLPNNLLNLIFGDGSFHEIGIHRKVLPKSLIKIKYDNNILDSNNYITHDNKSLEKYITNRYKKKLFNILKNYINKDVIYYCIFIYLV